MQKNKDIVFIQIQKKWYAQGFSGTPFLLAPCAASGFDLTPILGDSFQSFLYDFKEEHGKMYYNLEDLQRLYVLILTSIQRDSSFLQNAREKYEQNCARYITELTKYATSSFATLSTVEILEFLKKGVAALRASVGIGHMIEPFSLSMDTILQDKVRKYIPSEKALHEALSLLTMPLEKSFLNEREDDLYAISRLPKSKQRQGIKRHLQKFFWARNSYAGRIQLTEKDIQEEVTAFKYNPIDFAAIKKKKQELMQTLPDKDLRVLLEALTFMASWQDTRKKNILIGVDYTERLLEELAIRIKSEVRLLRYLLPSEIQESLLTQSNLNLDLAERRKGCIYFMTQDEQEWLLTGKDYQRFHRQMSQKDVQQEQTTIINGIPASMGNAIGKVKICKTAEDINSIKEGEILVASMTRPEFLPAMKKAAAFITDEGGITCHAAIVAREMKKPCIIGTKIATKVLKDGDIVEVKANHGLVRKISP